MLLKTFSIITGGFLPVEIKDGNPPEIIFLKDSDERVKECLASKITLEGRNPNGSLILRDWSNT
jgi:hypothetical protein